jgi:Ca2+ transporting ATPase
MNDVNAIGQADVGFAMGTGKTMARDAASMIMATDEFLSLARAVMWGRNIYTNVKRFVQFQFTCNISTLFTVFMGYCFLIESPLNAIQLLWINLLMDTLAALALSTTPPFTNIMQERPVRGEEQTLTSVVWR